ncbi:MAG: hypothetical protein A2365_01920 [Candidatus Nealsonbacteria bacterium RIFOXYB1_FULL_40_15]|uniref:GerMN domain-containing protein n=2 Tax=Candidatus Nealsoniibacteriota TaxID=1817911 RepID=A0A1G2EUD0_9BACT|nr:MAG: hypothetical protein A2365_01920 [Candidatus Nealsonbacteria bacterium RIFOXYB1_FULL_40_15]OGZ29112.1 MAG: hypothetical protein A2427_02370 [Candidatus Nealsonbacteria bacterium RIFOXYC1_FULL_40_7]OGZ29353.1 MAG: hypothetical protein A2562_01190 [Candidatus Nealsonbacteria bacterium RIFOXYD1_FULL_39_11]
MNKKNLAIIIILVLIILGVGLYYAFFAKEEISQEEINFNKTGRLAINNPGMDENTWYFIYEEPGQPALVAKLDIKQSAVCYENSAEKSCADIEFLQSQKVEVKGFLSENIVSVHEIKILEETIQVIVYYRDKNAKNEDVCSEEGLMPVFREVSEENKIEETLDLLLSGYITEQEKERGVATEFPLEGLEIESFVLEDGKLTLVFRDPNNKTVGGACRVGALWSQISKTAKQFEEVKEVKFSPEDALFQP